MSSSRNGFTRRGFLATAAATGAGVAASTLASRWPRRPDGPDPAVVGAIPGEIVGASASRGHGLRTPAIAPWVDRAPASVERARTAIVGSGIAGLSAAWAFDHAGWDDYRVLELEPRVGGTSTWGRTPAGGCPWGAHYLPLPTRESRAVRRLLDELGLITGWTASGEPIYDETALCQAPQERLYIHARWQDGIWPEIGATADDHAQLDRFYTQMEQWRNRRTHDGRPAFALPVALSSSDAEVLALDRLSMADWLRQQGFTSRRLRWYVEYATRDDYGCTLENTSAWAGIHYFTSRVTGGAMRSGKPSSHASDTDPVLTWPEGNGWLARKLRDRVGDSRLRTDATVFRVEAGAREVAVDWFDGREVRRLVCDSVVLAVPRFVAVRICPAYGATASGPASAFTYAPWVVSNVEVDQLPFDARPGGPPVSWDNVIHDSDSLGYVVSTHQSLATIDGPSVLTHYHPLTRGEPRNLRATALARSWSQWRDGVLADLWGPHPGIEQTVKRLDVMVWGHAMVRPTPGFMWGAARLTAADTPPRVAVAHCDLSGLAVFEEAQYHGVRAAQRLMEEAAHPFEPLL